MSARNMTMEVAPNHSARTIYYPQNFKKVKPKRKIKLVKKTSREESKNLNL
jgi:hypothetical protein